MGRPRGPRRGARGSSGVGWLVSTRVQAYLKFHTCRSLLPPGVGEGTCTLNEWVTGLLPDPDVSDVPSFPPRLTPALRHLAVLRPSHCRHHSLQETNPRQRCEDGLCPPASRWVTPTPPDRGQALCWPLCVSSSWHTAWPRVVLRRDGLGECMASGLAAGAPGRHTINVRIDE